MGTYSSNHLLILLPLIFLLTLFAGCQPPAPMPGPPATPINFMAPAETPILETILDIDHKLIVPYHPAGMFIMDPGKRMELRLRVPWPTAIQVQIDGKPLTEATDSASHPELDGYYRVLDIHPIEDTRMFWRVLVVLPQDKQGNVDFTMTVQDKSTVQNESGQKEATLEIKVCRTPIDVTKPSSVFFDGPDAKHNKTGPDPAFMADNVTLAGWLIGDDLLGRNNGVDPATEDWHYGLSLDNDFIERNYAPNTEPFASAIMPGRWFNIADNIVHPKKPMSLTDGKHLNASTFMLPGNGYLEVELNAWHVSKHNGQHPNGWVPDPEPGWPDLYWPFPPMKPFGIGPNDPPLQKGDYVIITGALVEDSIHHPPGERWCWHEHYNGHGGWLEIHPVDAIRRVPSPTVRKTPQQIQLCGDATSSLGMPIYAFTYLEPTPSAPPFNDSVLRCREIIDDRFTDMSTVQAHAIGVSPDAPNKLSVLVGIPPNGHFEAIYQVWWDNPGTPPCPTLDSSGSQPQPLSGSGPPLQPEDLPICSKEPGLPQCDHPTLD
jgi:hypothetical protein